MTTAANAAFVETLDSALPQTQCTRCGYPCCRAYAEALAHGQADINQCPPGGDVTVRALAKMLGVAPKPIDPKFGAHRPRRRALIDEGRCIGCRKCIDACPVDAIVGTHKWMHTVIAAQCSGCELCLPPCPVDCIDMVPIAMTARGGIWPEYTDQEVKDWRARTLARLGRLARRSERPKTGAASNRRDHAGSRETPSPNQIRAEIAVARERVRHKRGGSIFSK